MTTATDIKVRKVTLPAGPATTVTTLPVDAIVLTALNGQMAVAYSDHSIHIINIDTGANTAYASGGGDTIYGGAFSPDGSHLAYVGEVLTSGGSGSTAQLRSLDLSAHSFAVVRTFTGTTYDIPRVWNASMMAAVQKPGLGELVSPGTAQLNPTSGARTATTTTSGSATSALSRDGSHVADTFQKTGLGDEGEGDTGYGPFNTLSMYTIGSTPAVQLTAAHHNLSVFAEADDGTVALFGDDSSIGAFPGITTSAVFGLFLWNGARVQLEHYGSTWYGGVLVSNTLAVVAGNVTGAPSVSLFSEPSGGPASTLDSVSGGTFATVWRA